MKTLLMIFTLITPFYCWGQTMVSGTVKTENTNQPIADCHVFITENIGTITNACGEFQLVITKEHTNSTLQVSHLSFNTYTKPVLDLGENVEIVMKPSVIMLEETVVQADRWITFKEYVEKIINYTRLATNKIYAAFLHEMEHKKAQNKTLRNDLIN